MNETKYKYEDNTCIKEAVEQFGVERTKENLFNLFNVMIDRMLANVEAPEAMVDVNGVMDYEKIMNLSQGDIFTLDQELRLRIDTVSTGDGIEWIPLYTDEEEINKQPTANVHINMPIANIIKGAYYGEGIEGLVINPFGKALTVPKNILKLVVEKYDEICADTSNE